MAGWNNSSLTRRLGSLHPPEENVTTPLLCSFLSFNSSPISYSPFAHFVNSCFSDHILSLRKYKLLLTRAIWINQVTDDMSRCELLVVLHFFHFFEFTRRFTRQTFVVCGFVNLHNATPVSLSPTVQTSGIRSLQGTGIFKHSAFQNPKLGKSTS